jgi:hypothetical protein
MRGGAFYKQRPKLDGKTVDYQDFIAAVNDSIEGLQENDIQAKMNELAQTYSIDPRHVGMVLYAQFLKNLKQKKNPDSELVRTLKRSLIKLLKGKQSEVNALRRRIKFPRRSSGYQRVYQNLPFSGGGADDPKGRLDSKISPPAGSEARSQIDQDEDGSIDESLQKLKRNKTVIIRKLLK